MASPQPCPPQFTLWFVLPAMFQLVFSRCTSQLLYSQRTGPGPPSALVIPREVQTCREHSPSLPHARQHVLSQVPLQRVQPLLPAVLSVVRSGWGSQKGANITSMNSPVLPRTHSPKSPQILAAGAAMSSSSGRQRALLHHTFAGERVSPCSNGVSWCSFAELTLVEGRSGQHK